MAARAIWTQQKFDIHVDVMKMMAERMFYVCEDEGEKKCNFWTSARQRKIMNLLGCEERKIKRNLASGGLR